MSIMLKVLRWVAWNALVVWLVWMAYMGNINAARCLTAVGVLWCIGGAGGILAAESMARRAAPKITPDWLAAINGGVDVLVFVAMIWTGLIFPAVALIVGGVGVEMIRTKRKEMK